jgi:hypothetical protein
MVILMTINNDNPFSAPTAEPPAKRGTTHHEFHLTEKGIRCRAGLELPKVCLVTGATENLTQHRIGIVWTPLFARFLFVVFPAIMALVPIATLFPNTLSSVIPTQLQSMKWLPLVGMGTIQFVIFGIAIFCPKGALISYLHLTVRRRLKRRMWITGIILALSAAIVFWTIVYVVDTRTGAAATSVIISIVFGAVLIAAIWIRSSRRESRSAYPGLALKAIGYHSGQFEIAGFTAEYLETLQRHRGNVDS